MLMKKLFKLYFRRQLLLLSQCTAAIEIRFRVSQQVVHIINELRGNIFLVCLSHHINGMSHINDMAQNPLTT